MDNLSLINKAKEAMKFSYSPYSKFRVGAALLTDNGEVYTGCNIENASFGGTNCAERTALFKAISEGNNKFTKIAIISDSKSYTAPCGICRQVLSEFSLDLEVIMANDKEEYITKTLRELLPLAFTSDDL